MKSLQLSRPYAIMMVGIPGSGKSFFASKFADTFSAPYIDLADIDPLSRDIDAAGEMTIKFLSEITKTKQTFIFEGNSGTRARRTEFARWARERNYVPLFVWTQTDQTTAKKRCAKLGSHSKEQFADEIRDFSQPHPDEKPVVISGKHTFASQARTVLNYLGRQNRPAAASPITTPKRPPVVAGRSVTVR